MFSKYLSICLLLASSEAFLIKAGQSKVKFPTVNLCSDSSSSWLSDVSLDITPWPVHVAAGEIIYADAEGTLLQTIESGTSVKLEMKLVTVLGDLVIPCIPVSTIWNIKLRNWQLSIDICYIQISDYQIGTCTYTAEWLMEKLAETGMCESLMAEGQACALPLNPGKYAEGEIPLVITMPEIPDALVPFFQGQGTCHRRFRTRFLLEPLNGIELKIHIFTWIHQTPHPHWTTDFLTVFTQPGAASGSRNCNFFHYLC